MNIVWLWEGASPFAFEILTDFPAPFRENFAPRVLDEIIRLLSAVRFQPEDSHQLSGLLRPACARPYSPRHHLKPRLVSLSVDFDEPAEIGRTRTHVFHGDLQRRFNDVLLAVLVSVVVAPVDPIAEGSPRSLRSGWLPSLGGPMSTKQRGAVRLFSNNAPCRRDQAPLPRQTRCLPLSRTSFGVGRRCYNLTRPVCVMLCTEILFGAEHA